MKIDGRTHSKGTNVFSKTSQSAFPTSSLFFMNFDLNYFSVTPIYTEPKTKYGNHCKRKKNRLPQGIN